MSGPFDHLKGHSPLHEAEALAKHIVNEVEAVVEKKPKADQEAPVDPSKPAG